MKDRTSKRKAGDVTTAPARLLRVSGPALAAASILRTHWRSDADIGRNERMASDVQSYL